MSSARSSALVLEARVQGAGTAAAALVCTARNVSGRVVHVFAGRRMPYVVRWNEQLVLLHGVHAPPEDRDLNMIEIPTTRPLAPGETLAFEVALAPASWRDHYGDVEMTPPRGETSIVCAVGHVEAEIDAAASKQLAIQELLARQVVEMGAALRVTLP